MKKDSPSGDRSSATRSDQADQRLAARLARRIRAALRLYGVFKYRYLLPLYRFLRLTPPTSASSPTPPPTSTVRLVNRVLALAEGRGHHAEQRGELHASIDHARGVVVFPASIGWQIPLAQRLHHLARAFARIGYVVLFDSTDTYDDVAELREVESGVWLFRGAAPVPPDGPAPIIWTVTYNYHRIAEYACDATLVYDWIDDLGVFPFDQALLERNHRAALETAHAVLAVSRPLLVQAIAPRPDALYVPNGVRFDDFAEPVPPPRDDPAFLAVVERRKPIVGYCGALAQWFDYELLDQVAAARPSWEIVLIGPAYDGSLQQRATQGLLQRPNVTWLGVREYGALPGYVHAFDAAMIPFVLNDITRATSPQKLYEYFAAGREVITTSMPECTQYAEVHVADDAAAFVDALDAALSAGRDHGRRAHLRAIGRANSWDARVRVVLERLAEAASGTRAHV